MFKNCTSCKTVIDTILKPTDPATAKTKKSNKTKQKAKPNAATAGNLKAYRKVYEKFDKDGDQSVSLDEICTALGIEKQDAEKELKKVDKNNDGTISFEEFYLLVKNEQKKIARANQKGKENGTINDEQWRSAFTNLDKDGSGTLGLDEFYVFWKEMDPTMSQTSVELLFAASDADGSGAISFDEFSAVLNFVSQ